MTSHEFESGCQNAIGGWLWDESFSLDYTEPVSLSVNEMRQIANLLRQSEKRELGTVQEWTDEKQERDAIEKGQG